MNQRITIIIVILLIVLCAVSIFNAFFQNSRINEAIDRLELAEQQIVTAIAENDHSTQLVNDLKFEIARTKDSLDILIAERDSIILSYKRWGSDEQYRIYNKELKEQTGKLEALRKKYVDLIATKNATNQ
tara:strand:+ start:26 stop:415 length:390 start_codon:yes stop_codon:yes gene_type:complete